MKNIKLFIQFMKKVIKWINSTIFYSITHLTYWFVDFKPMKENINNMELQDFFKLKYFVAGAIAFFFVLWIYYSAKVYIQKVNNEMIDKIEDKYKAFTEVFSKFMIYSSITNKLVRDIVLPKMKDEELADLLFDKRYFLDELKKYGINEKAIKLIELKYLEEKIEEIKKEINEFDRDNK